MDRFKKLKKERSGKSLPKEKQPVFITDVKSFKENVKIKEILRSVKMNSSMRLKAPSENIIMKEGGKEDNKDFNDENCFEESTVTQNSDDLFSATNPDVVVSNAEEVIKEINIDNNYKESTKECDNGNGIQDDVQENIYTREGNMAAETANFQSTTPAQTKTNRDDFCFKRDINNRIRNGNTLENIRDRKLSLDHSMLSRREGLSAQSELDLHSMGKLPLERKSSFFRKTMDSFVRNTTEIFKKQNKSLQRRLSMSCSLQSLNEKCLTSNDSREVPIQQVIDAPEDNCTDLQLPPQIARSNSSLTSMVQCQSPSLVGSYSDSQPTLQSLPGSTPENLHACSVNSLNEAYVKETMLNSRAISMSSGLDSSFGHPRRKSSRSNRVTWVASEGLTNYLRRVIQDEKTREIQSCQSYQDFSCIPENEQYGRKIDTKGRRLSYQRAVSGEDPVMPSKHPDSTLRRKQQMPDMCETHMEIAALLADFTRCGLPTVQGFELPRVSDEAFAWLLWACDEDNFYKIIKLANSLPAEERERQATIRELITSEVEHIKHMLWIVEVYIGAAHWLQEKRRMMTINTAKLFYNIPDVLNANIYFWSEAFMPMIKDAWKNNRPFKAELMRKGFCESFAKIFAPYEKYMVEQNNILEYYRSKQDEPEFKQYLTWCQNKKKYQRLQLNDFFAKPFQRLTKYELLIDRIVQHTHSEPDRSSLLLMEASVKAFVKNVNYSVRQREEIEKVDKLQHTLEPYGCDLRDEDLEGVFNKYSSINLSVPMLHCRSLQRRCIIHQENLRYRNGHKETDALVIVMTDMLLVCKRTKGPRRLKMIKPAYMIDKLVQTPKFDNKNSQELSALCYIVLNELGFSSGGFVLTESSRDPQHTLRIFENKMKEAMLTYELHIQSTRNLNKEVTDAEVKQMMDYLQIRARSGVEDANIMREARERVAAMVHESAAASKLDPALYSSEIASEVVVGVSARQSWPNLHNHLLHRTVTTSYPKSPRLTILKPCTRSHCDEEQPGPSTSRLRRTVSLDCLMKSPIVAAQALPSNTVQESNGELQPPIRLPSPTLTASLTPSGKSDNSHQRQILRLHSHNNVTTLQTRSSPVGPRTPIVTVSTTQSVSEKMYQTHNESLQKNRLDASPQCLTPDHRSTSTPQTPTRISLRRGLAFSFSIKTSHLTKTERAGSSSPLPTDDPQSTSQHISAEKRGVFPKPKQNTERTEKKSKLPLSSRLHVLPQGFKEDNRLALDARIDLQRANRHSVPDVPC